VRGSAFLNATPTGLYVIALHGHDEEGPNAYLALTFVGKNRDATPDAFALLVAGTEDQILFTFQDWSGFLVTPESYFGTPHDRSAAKAHPRAKLALQVAERIVQDLEDVARYLG
jgi:hypothetical protein